VFRKSPANSNAKILLPIPGGPINNMP
ncbi:uncharacterized protein METZ01_LOCUS41473, partial [marine metagenome]